MFSHQERPGPFHSSLISLLLGYINSKVQGRNLLIRTINQIYISELMSLLKSSKRFVKPEWTFRLWHYLWGQWELLKIAKKAYKWDNKNSLPAITVVVWGWFLGSDGWNHHENQSWAPCLLVVVLGLVPLVLSRAAATIIGLIVERLIIRS